MRASSLLLFVPSLGSGAVHWLDVVHGQYTSSHIYRFKAVNSVDKNDRSLQ